MPENLRPPPTTATTSHTKKLYNTNQKYTVNKIIIPATSFWSDVLNFLICWDSAKFEMVACLSFQNWKIFCISVVHHGLYDNDVVTLMTVYKWYEQFKSKNQSAQDKPLEHQIRQIEKVDFWVTSRIKIVWTFFLMQIPTAWPKL